MKNNVITLSNEEVAARDAEGRKATAESQFVTICEDKKRVLIEIDALNKKLADGKSILEQNLVEIENANKNLKEIKDFHIKENESLERVSRERVLAEKDLENFKSTLDSKKNQIAFDISSLEKNHEIKKAKSLAELKSFEDSKQLVIDEIKSKNVLLETLRKEEVEYLKKINILENSHKETLARNSGAEFNLAVIGNEIITEKNNLGDLKKESDKISDEIVGKQNEIKELNISIAKKEGEYKALESKMFSVSQREIALAQKEAFIKSQYERAGVQWEQ